MLLRILPFLMLPLLGIGQTNSKVEKPVVGNTTSEKQPLEIKRNAQYNLDEIKVRWKKAALENCTGFPCIVAPSFTCGTSTVSDIDNNVYNTVSIGTQCWIKENLKVTKYNDGTVIPDETANTAGWGALATGARSDYTGEASYIATYGYLYNWYAATDSRKICPNGWHVPTDGEWTSLIQFTVPTETVSATFIGIQSPNAGGKLKSKSTNDRAGNGFGWDPGNPQPSPGTDDFGFSALPSGYRHAVTFEEIRINAFFWSATEVDDDYAWNRDLYNSTSNVNRIDYYTNKYIGASVRCLRD
jgi:uncharacterized protein (TIGR02145 family)